MCASSCSSTHRQCAGVRCAARPVGTIRDGRTRPQTAGEATAGLARSRTARRTPIACRNDSRSTGRTAVSIGSARASILCIRHWAQPSRSSRTEPTAAQASIKPEASERIGRVATACDERRVPSARAGRDGTETAWTSCSAAIGGPSIVRLARRSIACCGATQANPRGRVSGIGRTNLSRTSRNSPCTKAGDSRRRNTSQMSDTTASSTVESIRPPATTAAQVSPQAFSVSIDRIAQSSSTAS